MIFSNKIFNISNNVKRNIIVNTDQGAMIVNRFDSNHDNVGHGRWLLDHGNSNTVEVDDCFTLIKHLTDPIIFDVGANIGTITIWLSKIFSKGEIYSFEAQRQIFYQLCGNIAINNLYNVNAFNLALDSKKGHYKIKEPNYFSNNDFGIFSLLEEKISTTNKDLIVESTTIDEFVKLYNIKKIDLIKIDVEGMDLEVLKGSIESLETFGPNLYIEHFDNVKSNLENIKSFLTDFHYYFEIRKNNLLCLK
jgi:FkbM family methyltransferase